MATPPKKKKTSQKKSGKRGGRPRGRAASSNANRHPHSWHRWWVWQLLRRNTAYRSDIAKIVEAVRPEDPQLWARLLSRGSGSKEEVESAIAQHSRFYEVCLDLMGQTLSHPESLWLKPTERGLRPVEAGEEYGDVRLSPMIGADLKSNSDQQALLEREVLSVVRPWSRFRRDAALFEHGFSEREMDILAWFRRRYDGLICFPLDPACAEPASHVLESVMTSVAALPLTPDPQHYGRAQVEPSSSVMETFVLSLNLRFSPAQIAAEAEAAIRDHLARAKSGVKVFDGLPLRAKVWSDLVLRLKVYDAKAAGEPMAEIIRRLFPPPASDAAAESQADRVRKWPTKIQRYIDQLDALEMDAFPSPARLSGRRDDR